MTIRAALFDIDGTLVDSNYLHVDAWSRTFDQLGWQVPAWRIHRSIGMDGAKLVETLMEDADEGTRKRAGELHSELYLPMTSRLAAFADARKLLRTLSERGLTVVLATSATQHELEKLRGVLDIEDAVDVVTSSEDVETAKPAPDIVQVALDRAGVQPGEAVMIGDSVWDVRAAESAGVASIGLLSGGISTDELRAAGAAAVYADPSELLAELPGSPLFR